MMLKKILRKDFLEKRQNLNLDQAETLSQNIAVQFIDWLPNSIFTVHTFLPIRKKKEINTWLIIDKLWEKGLNTVVPVMDMSTISLSSWVLTPETKLQDNIWGIPEPINAHFAHDSVIDLVIVPLLSFDEKGYRVGYGKGYYDKFLSSLENQPLKIGLSFFDPIPKISDLHNDDIPMDFCITPYEILDFR